MAIKRQSQYIYRMVQVPPDVEINSASDRGHAAELYLTSLTAEMGHEGWDFFRIDTIGVVERPGCMARLLGFGATVTYYYVVAFRRLRQPKV